MHKKKKSIPCSAVFSLMLLLILSAYHGYAQTVHYQNSIKGGFATVANCLDLAANKFANTAGGVTMSSSSDLVLPPGSTIVKAYLSVEGFARDAATGSIGTMKKITSVRFKAGNAPYTLLSATSPGFIASRIESSNMYAQFLIDITSLMPANGYISTVTPGGDAGTSARYSIADVTPSVAANQGYGWTIFVVYTNPNSKYRSITIADACLTTQQAVLLIPNVIVPSSGTVNAVIGVTGSFGDVGLIDLCGIGNQGGPVPVLSDPTTHLAQDILNSTIGFAPNNNVSADGGPAINGDFTARNPYNTFTEPLVSNPPAWHSYYYDSDILDARSSLTPSPTPITVQFLQIAPNNGANTEIIGYGAYAISIDIVAAKLTKIISPSQIFSGQTATYTFTIDNTAAGASNCAAYHHPMELEFWRWGHLGGSKSYAHLRNCGNFPCKNESDFFQRKTRQYKSFCTGEYPSNPDAEHCANDLQRRYRATKYHRKCYR